MESKLILVLNVDRAVLKFELFERCAGNALRSVVHGKVSGIGGDSVFEWGNCGVNASICVNIRDLKDAADWVFDWLEHLWPLGSLLDGLKIVACRCVNCNCSEYRPGRSVIGESDPQCVMGFSRERFPDSVKIMAVLDVDTDKTGTNANEEAHIALAALEAADPP